MHLQGVYKEIAFKGGQDLDIYYVNAWVCIFQFLVGYRQTLRSWLRPNSQFLVCYFVCSLVFLPVTAIPGFGGLTFDEIPDNLGSPRSPQPLN